MTKHWLALGMQRSLSGENSMKRYEIRTNDGHIVNTVYADSIIQARVKMLKIYGCHAWEFKANLDKSVLNADYRR